jgi:hypothetical protein
MKISTRVAAMMVLSAACLSASTAGTMQMPSGPPWLVNIPPDAKREVLGVWRIKGFNCSRSIELVAGELLLVSWCDPDVRGTTGIPLRKDPKNAMRYVHKFVPTATYEMSADGYLVMSFDGHIDAVGVPVVPPGGERR